MKKSSVLTLLLSLIGLASASPVKALEKRQNNCVIGGINPGVQAGPTIIHQVITTTIVVFPILINTFIKENTILNYNGGVIIKINNAPTSLILIATGTSIATNTATTTVIPQPNGNTIQIFQEVNIINFPVYISTFIQQNAILQYGGGINILINNAPTFFITATSGTSTVTTTLTSTVTTGNSQPTAFLLAPQAANARSISRRQSQIDNFLDQAGDIVASCSKAAVFTIEQGLLISNDRRVSTNTSVGMGVLISSQEIGNISTTFNLSDSLVWINDAFDGGQARFCSSNGKIFGIYRGDGPATCLPIDLVSIAASLCEDGIIVLPSSSATSTSTSIDSSSTSSSVTTSTGISSSSSSVPFIASTTIVSSSTASDSTIISSVQSTSSSSSTISSSQIPSSSTSDSESSTAIASSASSTPSTTAETISSTTSNSLTSSSLTSIATTSSFGDSTSSDSTASSTTSPELSSTSTSSTISGTTIFSTTESTSVTTTSDLSPSSTESSSSTPSSTSESSSTSTSESSSASTSESSSSTTESSSTSTTESSSSTTEAPTTTSSTTESSTTTTTTSATPVQTPGCAVNLTPGAGSICGTLGLINTFDYYLEDLFDSVSTTPLGCAKACFDRGDCLSFYLQVGSFCELMSGTSADLGFVPMSNSWYEAYDLSCFACV